MKILVFIKPVPDVKIPLGFDRATGRLKADWNLAMLNPADRSALNTALSIKKQFPGTHITVVHIGPAFEERWIRDCLAVGCDQGIRVWDEGLDEIQTPAKAVILARTARILSFDLILMGSKSQDTGNEQAATLLASHLQVPCIGPAMSIETKGQDRGFIVTKRLAGGFQERVENPFPFIVAKETGDESDGYASLPALFAATEAEIECFDLAAIGIPRQLIEDLNSRLAFGPLKPPRARSKYIPAPDSSLPGFERILRLVQGTVKRREGKVVAGGADVVVEELFRTLLDEGWLSHLRKNE